MTTRAGSPARAVAISVHRYVGLATAVFLGVAGLTGTAIAFFDELDAAINPQMMVVAPPSPDAQPLPPLELRERLRSLVPERARVERVPLHWEPTSSVRFYVEPPPGVEGLDDNYYLNPYTGELLGSRRYADLSQGMKNLMPFVYRLHYRLALGQVGNYLMGIVALLWTIDCFVGAYLTFPPARRQAAPARQKSWHSRWKPAWLIRANKLFSFVFTWHRASGLWVWAMLLVLAWSSVGLNLPEVYNPVMQGIFRMDQRAHESVPELKERRPLPVLSFHEAHERGKALMAMLASEHGFEVIRGHRLDYDQNRGAYRYRVLSSRDISDRSPNTTIHFDGNDGKLLAWETPTGQNTGRTITTWLYHLHWASLTVGGLPYRIFVSLMGLVVTALSVTGVWIWLRKRRKRAPKRASHEAGAPRTLEAVRPLPLLQSVGPRDENDELQCLASIDAGTSKVARQSRQP
jgi:uncharacterized iron-regulated membrane protein